MFFSNTRTFYDDFIDVYKMVINNENMSEMFNYSNFILNILINTILIMINLIILVILLIIIYKFIYKIYKKNDYFKYRCMINFLLYRYKIWYMMSS